MRLKEARASGAMFYTGKVCAKHPGLQGQRRASNGNCHLCIVERMAKVPREVKTEAKRRQRAGMVRPRNPHRDAIEKARAEGEMYYAGKACAKHPKLGGKRYASSLMCVECNHERRKARRKRRKEAASVAAGGE
jgi:hypothetical protein